MQETKAEEEEGDSTEKPADWTREKIEVRIYSSGIEVRIYSFLVRIYSTVLKKESTVPVLK
jgi:hypothetical protein